jgi:hypothetical protein
MRTPAAAVLLDPIRERLVARGQRVCDGCGDAGETDPATGIVFENSTAFLSSGLGSPAAPSAPPRLIQSGLVIALGDVPTLPQQEGSTPPTHTTSNTSNTSDAFDSADPFDRFVEACLASGARAISAHIGEPSLAGVTRPAVQLRSWTRGESAVEAHFKSVPHLGWLNVFIGDPLATLDAAPYSPASAYAMTAAASERKGSAPAPVAAAPAADTRDLSSPPTPQPFDEADRDGDGIPDVRDNCLDVPNPLQRDTNGDRIGNRCDPDVNNDGRVDTSWGQIYPVDGRGDLEAIALTARNGPHNPDHDLDGDGRVDERDLAIAQLWLFRAPGRSGYSGSPSEVPDPLAAALVSPRNISIKLDVSDRPEPER